MFLSRRAPAQQDSERALLTAFVEAGERAKAAYDSHQFAQANQLYAEAIRKAAPLSRNQQVQEVLTTFQTRFEETKAATNAHPASASSAAPRGPLSEIDVAVNDLVVPKSSGVRWDSVVGLDGAKRALWEAVVLPGLNPELFSGLRAPPRGIMLYGPPGNGKTFLARAAAGECNSTFFSVSASSLTSKWHGESEKIVRALFTQARERAPSVIFIDEIDSVLSARSSSESETARRLKTEFLVQLDGLTPSAGSPQDDGRVVVLAATNRPFDLDEAVLRRLPIRVHVALPDVAARQRLLQSLVGEHRHSLTASDFAEIARQCENFSSSDITSLCREASMVAIRELSSQQVASMTADKMRPITVQDLMRSLEVIRPSSSPAAVATLDEWAKSQGKPT